MRPAGAIDFDAALEAYLKGGSHEDLLQAAGKVIDCNLPIAPKHADTISRFTDHLDYRDRDLQRRCACDPALVLPDAGAWGEALRTSGDDRLIGACISLPWE